MKESEVVRFLEEHPDFFHEHLELLEKLSVPHPLNSAKTVSLIERQVHLLRTSTASYKQEFQRLVQAARENESIILRSKKIISAGMSCSTLDDFAILLDDVMRKDFMIESYALTLFSEQGLDTNIPVCSLAGLTPSLKDKMIRTDHYFDSLSTIELQSLFPNGVDNAKVFAIFPLLYRHQGIDHYLGVLALSSEDECRFQREKNTLSLEYFSDLLSSILIRLML